MKRVCAFVCLLAGSIGATTSGDPIDLTRCN